MIRWDRFKVVDIKEADRTIGNRLYRRTGPKTPAHHRIPSFLAENATGEPQMVMRSDLEQSSDPQFRLIPAMMDQWYHDHPRRMEFLKSAGAVPVAENAAGGADQSDPVATPSAAEGIKSLQEAQIALHLMQAELEKKEQAMRQTTEKLDRFRHIEELIRLIKET